MNAGACLDGWAPSYDVIGKLNLLRLRSLSTPMGTSFGGTHQVQRSLYDIGRS
jgi:hypothetical protein